MFSAPRCSQAASNLSTTAAPLIAQPARSFHKLNVGLATFKHQAGFFSGNAGAADHGGRWSRSATGRLHNFEGTSLRQPDDRQLAVLKAVIESDGFCEHVEDNEAAEACAWAGWLIAEGATGFGLTLDGRAMVARLLP